MTDSTSRPMPPAKKRKRGADDGSHHSHGHGHGSGLRHSLAITDDANHMHPDRTNRIRPDLAPEAKKPKRINSSENGSSSKRKAKSKKERKEKSGGPGGGAAGRSDHDQDLDLDRGLNRAIARMDNVQLADHLARQIKRLGRDLSAVELADLAVGAGAIADTASSDDDDSSIRTLANLPGFLAAACAPEGGRSYLSSAPQPNGAPHTIVVTGAGLRAADLVRALRGFQSKTSTVSKMFAKHIKIAEAVAFLKSHRTGIAVGTPARLIDLMDQGALSVAHLRRVIVDASHIDLKKRGVLDMQDTALPLARFLTRPEFKARYASDSEVGTEASIDAGGSKATALPPLKILFY